MQNDSARFRRLLRVRSLGRIKLAGVLGGCGACPDRRRVRLCRCRGCAGAGAVPVPGLCRGRPDRLGGRRPPGCRSGRAKLPVRVFGGARTLLPPVIFRVYLTPLWIFPGRILLPIEFSRALSYLWQNFSGARVCAHNAGNSPFATHISHACENIFAVFARKAQIS